MRIIAVISWIAVAAPLAGCAPMVSGVQVVKANIALSAAETAGAREHAPYEYNSAVEYLKKAREEASYSDFAGSREFAAKALDLAERAKEKAVAVSSAGQPVALPAVAAPPTDTPPMPAGEAPPVTTP